MIPYDINVGKFDKLYLLLNTNIEIGMYIYANNDYLGKILSNGKALTLYKELQFLFPTLERN